VARFSNSDATITTPSSAASGHRRSVEGPGNRLGQVEQPGILFAAEVLRAEQFLQEADDLRAARPRLRGSLLDHLKDRAVLALVTGNLTRIGWRKLQRAGLDGYFRFGAFGEMAATRGGLARLAIERARREGAIGPIALVGDAPQDVRAAQENGIRSIAVRTGVTPPGDLEACNPDCIHDDLTQFDFDWMYYTLHTSQPFSGYKLSI
jgi:beta-phosphoglucomutase-like phosphatase (HAD superfamily)